MSCSCMAAWLGVYKVSLHFGRSSRHRRTQRPARNTPTNHDTFPCIADRPYRPDREKSTCSTATRVRLTARSGSWFSRHPAIGNGVLHHVSVPVNYPSVTLTSSHPFTRLYGLSVHQTYRYLQAYPKDIALLKGLVREISVLLVFNFLTSMLFKVAVLL